MSFKICTRTNGEIVVTRNQLSILHFSCSLTYQNLLFINETYRTTSHCAYLSNNFDYIDHSEHNLMIEFVKIYLSGLIL